MQRSVSKTALNACRSVFRVAQHTKKAHTECILVFSVAPHNRIQKQIAHTEYIRCRTVQDIPKKSGTPSKLTHQQQRCGEECRSGDVLGYSSRKDAVKILSHHYCGKLLSQVRQAQSSCDKYALSKNVQEDPVCNVTALHANCLRCNCLLLVARRVAKERGHHARRQKKRATAAHMLQVLQKCTAVTKGRNDRRCTVISDPAMHAG